MRPHLLVNREEVVGSIIGVYEVEKEKTFYLKFEQGFMSKTHKLHFPISHARTHTHTHTNTFYKLCVLMLHIKFLTHTCNSLQMFTCEPKTVQVQQNLNILFCWRYTYTWCPRRNGQNFRRVFLMLKYTDITQNTYIQS
jgi:hypothetical protein